MSEAILLEPPLRYILDDLTFGFVQSFLRPAMIQLSQAAIDEIKRLQSRQHANKTFFRLGTEASGCAGLSYTLSFDPAINPDDQVFTCKGLSVLVSDRHLKYLTGLTVDYSEDLMGGGFRFHNPNAAQTCGCGNSFALEVS